MHFLARVMNKNNLKGTITFLCIFKNFLVFFWLIPYQENFKYCHEIFLKSIREYQYNLRFISISIIKVLLSEKLENSGRFLRCN